MSILALTIQTCRITFKIWYIKRVTVKKDTFQKKTKILENPTALMLLRKIRQAPILLCNRICKYAHYLTRLIRGYFISTSTSSRSHGRFSPLVTTVLVCVVHLQQQQQSWHVVSTSTISFSIFWPSTTSSSSLGMSIC